MTKLIAVLPARIRRRWDAIALQQLAEAAVALAAENDELAARVRWAEESADMWQQIAEIEQERGTVGLTMDGRVVQLERSDASNEPVFRGSVQ